MSRFCLALAACGLIATSAAAQQPVTGTTTATPVITSTTSAPITYTYGPYVTRNVTTTSPTPAPRGLFARLRARGASTTTSPVYSNAPVYSSPIMTAPTTAPAIAPSPGVPMQMPGKMSMMMPGAGMQTVVVSGMAYQVPNPLPPEGVVISERIITPMSEIMPASAMQTTLPTGEIVNLTFRYTGPSGTMVMPAPGLGITLSNGQFVPGSVRYLTTGGVTGITPASGVMMMPGSGTIITTGGPIQMMPGAVVPATYTTPATRTTTRPRR